MPATPFGPGTVTIGTTPYDFSCEVVSGSVTHEYEEVGEARTMLCGTEVPATRKRNDGLTFELETDLMDSGLYAHLHTYDADDPAPVDVSYTPHNDTAASWEGQVQPLLPASVDGSEFGAMHTASVEWPAVGHLAFTPGVTPVP